MDFIHLKVVLERKEKKEKRKMFGEFFQMDF